MVAHTHTGVGVLVKDDATCGYCIRVSNNILVLFEYFHNTFYRIISI